MQFMDNQKEAGNRRDAKYTVVVKLPAELKKRGIGKKAFAKAAGISYSTFHQAMNGKPVAHRTARLISDALGKDIEKAFRVVSADRGLAGSTQLHYYRLISVILQTAVYWQFLEVNPCDRVKPPKVRRKEAEYLDDGEALRLIGLLNEAADPYRTAIFLLLYLGCRRGELLGLKWKHINFDKGIVTIEQAALYTPELGIFIDTPKNEISARVVKISADILAMLRSYKAWQSKQRLLAGDQWHDDGFVFTRWDGQVIRPDTLSSWFGNFAAKTDLPHISLKSLRHTNATLMIMAGVPIRTVADRLGHAKTSTTTDIYSHAIQSMNEQAADVLSGILNPAFAGR
jgi:integrase